MILTYKRESVCECGFRALKDSVPLGTKYEVHPTIRTPLKMKCGGCGKVNDLTVVFALGNEYGKEGILPIEIFEDTVTQQERYERAKSKLKMFETKHGNAYLFPSNQRERALAIKHLQLQDAVSDAYWTDEMEVALRGEFTNEAALTDEAPGYKRIGSQGYTHEEDKEGHETEIKKYPS